jgi:hypothetical protein
VREGDHVGLPVGQEKEERLQARHHVQQTVFVVCCLPTTPTGETSTQVVPCAVVRVRWCVCGGACASVPGKYR